MYDRNPDYKQWEVIPSAAEGISNVSPLPYGFGSAQPPGYEGMASIIGHIFMALPGNPNDLKRRH
ncbi:hypothetical protein [uncultured Cyclobacterium sp.]|uniref:hypothetical protein n=1 Tax=uncultured Cyclobacterium sp. TaxID=453820 RepID=UPI0030ECBC42